MRLNETNGSSTFHQSNARTIFRLNATEDFLSINKLIEECSKISVTIIQLPDKRLEAGLNILPLKAKYKDNPDNIVVFITRFNEKNINVSGYFEGKKIESSNATTEEGIAKLIKRWAETKRSNHQDTQKQSLAMIQKLTKKCGEMAKQQKNQLMAVQKLKSTKEYMTVVEYQIQLLMQIDSLTEVLNKMEREIDDRNENLLQKIMPIEVLKNQIEEYQYEYEETGRFFKNIKEQIAEALEKQQQRVQKMEIQSEAQLNQFLAEAKQVKKLELQKRFLA